MDFSNKSEPQCLVLCFNRASDIQSITPAARQIIELSVEPTIACVIIVKQNSRNQW